MLIFPDLLIVLSLLYRENSPFLRPRDNLGEMNKENEMKKLMFVAAVAAGMVAFGDAIESQNVVGYQNLGVNNGDFNWLCNTFKAVDGRLWTLADIVPNENYLFSILQFLGPTGATKKFTLANDDEVYGEFEYWPEADIDPDELASGETATTGWDTRNLDSKLVLMNSVQIPEGGMFVVDALDDDAAVGVNGQVDAEDTECLLVNGDFNWYGNCTPVPLTLADIVPNENYLFSILQFLSPTGATKKFTLANDDEVYGEFEYWPEADIDPDELASGETATTGWYVRNLDGKLVLMNSVSIPAGAAFCVDALDDDASVIVPSAL